MNLRVDVGLLVVALVFACARTKSSGTTDDASTVKAADATAGRPSDEGEGLPGYLRDPNLITTRSASDAVEVAGPVGAVVLTPGAPLPEICAAETPITAVATLLSDSAAAPVTVKILGRTLVNTDGSFALMMGRLPDPKEALLTIVLGAHCEELTAAKLKGQKVLVAFREPGESGGFKTGTQIIVIIQNIQNITIINQAPSPSPFPTPSPASTAAAGSPTLVPDLEGKIACETKYGTCQYVTSRAFDSNGLFLSQFRLLLGKEDTGSHTFLCGALEPTYRTGACLDNLVEGAAVTCRDQTTLDVTAPACETKTKMRNRADHACGSRCNRTPYLDATSERFGFWLAPGVYTIMAIAESYGFGWQPFVLEVTKPLTVNVNMNKY